MLVNVASRLLAARQMKSFITKLVKEEIVSKLLNKQITLDDLAVNVCFFFFRKKYSRAQIFDYFKKHELHFKVSIIVFMKFSCDTGDF